MPFSLSPTRASDRNAVKMRSLGLSLALLCTFNGVAGSARAQAETSSGVVETKNSTDNLPSQSSEPTPPTTRQSSSPSVSSEKATPYSGIGLEDESLSPSQRKKLSRKVKAAAEKNAEKSNLAGRRPRKLFMTLKVAELSPSTRELADQLEILQRLQELYQPEAVRSPQLVAMLREDVIETILEAYFDAASVVAEAEREQARLEVLRETMINKRDKAVEINNATNFMASGTLNTIGSALGFPRNAAPFPGNLGQMLSGVVSTGMSMYALKQNSGGKTYGWAHPTIVAELFGRPTDERTIYPESVWRFMHGQMPTHETLTRAQWLESAWIQNQHLDPHGSRREQRKIDIVCGVASEHADVSIDDLSDEITIISDISASASQMIHHLRDLLRMVDSDVVGRQ